MLRSSTSLFLAVFALFASAAPAAPAADGWTADFEAAKALAEAEGKSLLLDFTGSDWCFWCKKLDGEVFQEQAFAEEAFQHFVPVVLDFPNDKSGLSAETQAQNERLRDLYGVRGYPTILLTDAAGRPFAKTGYREGGVAPYLAHLKELRGVAVRFDAALAEADGLEGMARARQLDRALSMLDNSLLTPSYADLMGEICAADADGAAGLAPRYRELLDVATRREALERIAGCIAAREPDLDWKGLVTDMDELLRVYAHVPPAAQLAWMAKGRALLELGELEGGLAALEASRAADPDNERVATIDRMIAEVRSELGVGGAP